MGILLSWYIKKELHPSRLNGKRRNPDPHYVQSNREKDLTSSSNAMWNSRKIVPDEPVYKAAMERQTYRNTLGLVCSRIYSVNGPCRSKPCLAMTGLLARMWDLSFPI